MARFWRKARVAAVAALVLSPAAVAGAGELDPRLSALVPLLGTWRGEFPNSTPGKPVVDVSRFEAALGGKVVRNLHSVNDGDYGGETILLWDEERKSIVFFYFTTGGFYTTGEFREDGGALVAHETVKGQAGGVTQVEARFRVEPDGRLRVTSRHLKGGQWEDARDMHYVRADGAEVRFR